MTNSNIALFDMDGTLADYNKAMIHDLNAIKSSKDPKATEENLHRLLNKYKHFELRKRLISTQPGWWRALDIMPLGNTVLKMCEEIGFDIHILTKGPSYIPAAWKEKVEWCQENLGRYDITITANKGLVYGKVLVDDFPDYIIKWLEWRPRGLVIMPDHPSNRHFTHINVIRLTEDSLKQVKRALTEAYER